MPEIVKIRDWKVGDENFILSTFLRGLYYGNDWFKEIPKDLFMTKYHDIIEYLLAKPNTVVKIACLKEDEDVILGYSIHRDSILDFIFVKKAWRKKGIGKALLPLTFTKVSHLTKVGRALKPTSCIFDPFSM